MKEEKLMQGTFGYIDAWKRSKRLSILIWAVFIALMLIIPWVIFKTRFNAFTVAAVVMVLPLARHIVQYIAMAPFKSVSREEYDKIAARVEGKNWLVLAADMVLVNESGHMLLNLILICNGNIYGYAPKQKKSREAIEAYLGNILAEAGFHKKPVVHENFEEFEEMAIMLSANEPSAQADVGEIFSGLKSVCM